MFGSNLGGQEVLQVMTDALTTYSRDIFRDFQNDLAPLLYTKRCRRVSHLKKIKKIWKALFRMDIV